MEYIIRFSHCHEAFRVAEIEALGEVLKLDLEILWYSDESPFCIVRLPSEEAARALMKRSILAQSIHEHWGTAETYEQLHANIKRDTSHLWPQYETPSFKLSFDTFHGSRSSKQKVNIINSFAYLGFRGPIMLRSPDEEFTIFEQWERQAVPLQLPDPMRIHFGRFVAHSVRDLIHKYDLKKRGYISTTSMDSELALVTANIAAAGPGRIFYDPFVGTGSFPVACAQFGALGLGSDLDGRNVRGNGGAQSLRGNFKQYGLESLLGDVFVCDMTNSPVRRTRFLDGIVGDPPYGVREGLRVLGVRDTEKDNYIVEKGKQMYKDPAFIPPKKPYSFMAMLDDILDFASDTLVDNGRLSFWMPTANDEEQEIPVPTHPCLEIVVVCTQPFNKWSRRLITYRRLPDSKVDAAALAQRTQQAPVDGHTADELNPFRRVYFKGFKTGQDTNGEVATNATQ